MIRLLEFHRSANCAKVRIALRYKGLAFEMSEMSAADRAPMVAAAGWPLVPILIDGDVALRDSEAILHYLESNYRKPPVLTPASIEEIRAGERIVAEAMHGLRPLIRRVYGQALRTPGERDPSALESVPRELEEALEPVDRDLTGKSFLLGDTPSLYDVQLAPVLTTFRPNPTYASQSPMWAFFAENLSLPRSLTNVGPWVDRVMAWDT